MTAMTAMTPTLRSAPVRNCLGTLRRATLSLALATTALSTLLVPAARTWAQTPSNTTEPDTLVLSDTLRYDDTKRTSVFSGNVVMTRGLMTLTADQLDLREDEQGFQHGVATVTPGKRVHIRQARPETFEVIEAQGTRGVYNGKTEQIDVIGQAVITRFICGQPFDTISGQRVRYHQKSDTYEAYGDPNASSQDGRVRSLAMPRARITAAIAACRDNQQAKPPTALRPASPPPPSATPGAGS